MKFRTFFQETKVKLLVITEALPTSTPKWDLGGGAAQHLNCKDPLSETIF